MAECRVCNCESKQLFSGTLRKIQVKYYECSACGYVQTEEPYWLEEAYKEPINATDTGLLWRNEWMRRVTASLIFFKFDRQGKYLDAAGGYGVFVRMMRDAGFEFYWKDAYTENIFAKGLEHNESQSYEMTTCFEAFEHFLNPNEEFEKLLHSSDNIFITTEIIPDPVPPLDDWWYYGTEHGQHIGFFRIKTLKWIADYHNMEFCSNGINFHLFSKYKIPDWQLILITKTSKLFYLFK